MRRPKNATLLDADQWEYAIRSNYGPSKVDYGAHIGFRGACDVIHAGNLRMHWISGRLRKVYQRPSENDEIASDVFMVGGISGAMRMEFDDRLIELETGGVMFVSPLAARTMHFDGEFAHVSVRLPVDFVSDAIGPFSFQGIEALDNTNFYSRAISTLINEVTYLDSPLQSDEASALSDAVYGLTASALRAATGRGSSPQIPPVSRSSQGLVARAVRWIEQNYRDPLATPEAIADSIGVSKRSLQRALGSYGLTANGLLRKTRLRFAAKALRKRRPSAETISALAFDHGFNSASYFTRSFRAEYGLSPREYCRLEQDTNT